MFYTKLVRQFDQCIFIWCTPKGRKASQAATGQNLTAEWSSSIWNPQCWSPGSLYSIVKIRTWCQKQPHSIRLGNKKRYWHTDARCKIQQHVWEKFKSNPAGHNLFSTVSAVLSSQGLQHLVSLRRAQLCSGKQQLLRSQMSRKVTCSSFEEIPPSQTVLNHN